MIVMLSLVWFLMSPSTIEVMLRQSNLFNTSWIVPVQYLWVKILDNSRVKALMQIHKAIAASKNVPE